MLPALKHLHEFHGFYIFYVVEDSAFLLLPSVTFTEVKEATKNERASVWAYGSYKKRSAAGHASWWGSKGFCIFSAWCQELTIILENFKSEAVQAL